jgi:hypothetical protein
MFNRSWSLWFKWKLPATTKRARASHQSVRLSLEPLEDRDLPAVSFSPLSVPLGQIAGQWSCGGQPARVQQLGNQLVFTNEKGVILPGQFLSATQVIVTGWGNLVGSLVQNGSVAQIRWSNNSIWERPLLPSMMTGTSHIPSNLPTNLPIYSNANVQISLSGKVAELLPAGFFVTATAKVSGEVVDGILVAGPGLLGTALSAGAGYIGTSIGREVSNGGLGSNIGGGVGGAIAFAMGGGPLGSFVGSTVGSLIGGAFDHLFGGDGPADIGPTNLEGLRQQKAAQGGGTRGSGYRWQSAYDDWLGRWQGWEPAPQTIQALQDVMQNTSRENMQKVIDWTRMLNDNPNAPLPAGANVRGGEAAFREWARKRILTDGVFLPNKQYHWAAGREGDPGLDRPLFQARTTPWQGPLPPPISTPLGPGGNQKPAQPPPQKSVESIVNPLIQQQLAGLFGSRSANRTQERILRSLYSVMTSARTNIYTQEQKDAIKQYMHDKHVVSQ